jgi:hypothetical protein
MSGEGCQPLTEGVVGVGGLMTCVLTTLSEIIKHEGNKRHTVKSALDLAKMFGT